MIKKRITNLINNGFHKSMDLVFVNLQNESCYKSRVKDTQIRCLVIVSRNMFYSLKAMIDYDLKSLGVVHVESKSIFKKRLIL